jgi:hypothetical protein
LNAVLLDTSFLISLSDPNRPHHAAAVAYYKECIRLRVRMMLSTVVVSEFQVRQSITDLQLRNFIVLPFNIDHAMACGLLVRTFPRDEGDDRVRVKDDMKLLAQCECDAIDYLFTEDASTLTKYAARISTTLKVVLLKDGFDAAHFNGGQAALGLTEAPATPDR